MRKLMILLGVVFVISCGNNQTKSANKGAESSNKFDIRDIKVQTLMSNIKDSAEVDTNLLITEENDCFVAIYLKGDSVIKLYIDSDRITQELHSSVKDYNYTMDESEEKGFFLFPFWEQFE